MPQTDPAYDRSEWGKPGDRKVDLDVLKAAEKDAFEEDHDKISPDAGWSSIVRHITGNNAPSQMDYLKFKPNYDELITYYEDTHPHKEIPDETGAAKKVKFSFFESVGSLICCQ